MHYSDKRKMLIQHFFQRVLVHWLKGRVARVYFTQLKVLSSVGWQHAVSTARLKTAMAEEIRPYFKYMLECEYHFCVKHLNECFYVCVSVRVYVMLLRYRVLRAMA